MHIFLSSSFRVTNLRNVNRWAILYGVLLQKIFFNRVGFNELRYLWCINGSPSSEGYSPLMIKDIITNDNYIFNNNTYDLCCVKIAARYIIHFQQKRGYENTTWPQVL